MLFAQAVGLPERDTIGPHLESARAVRLCLTSPRDLAFTRWISDVARALVRCSASADAGSG